MTVKIANNAIELKQHFEAMGKDDLIQIGTHTTTKAKHILPLETTLTAEMSLIIDFVGYVHEALDLYEEIYLIH